MATQQRCGDTKSQRLSDKAPCIFFFTLFMVLAIDRRGRSLPKVKGAVSKVSFIGIASLVGWIRFTRSEHIESLARLAFGQRLRHFYNLGNSACPPKSDFMSKSLTLRRACLMTTVRSAMPKAAVLDDSLLFRHKRISKVRLAVSHLSCLPVADFWKGLWPPLVAFEQ